MHFDVIYWYYLFVYFYYIQQKYFNHDPTNPYVLVMRTTQGGLSKAFKPIDAFVGGVLGGEPEPEEEAEIDVQARG